MKRAALWLDTFIFFVLMTTGIIIGTHYLSMTQQKGQFYQEEFAPAVMEACGRGYNAPVQNTGSEPLYQFLLLKVSTFSCDQLPEHIETQKLNAFQAVHSYLFRAVAITWRIAGISWDALDLLKALLFGGTVAISYLIFRLASNRIFSLVGAGLLAFSATQLSYLPHLRDYSKAPFMLAGVLLIAFLVTRESDKIKRSSAVLAGAILGLGLGFRMDLMLAVPFAVIAIIFFSHERWNSRAIAERAKLVGLFFIVWFCCAWPILSAVGGGSNTFHVILLGLATPFDSSLGIQAPFYEWLERYNDSFLYSVLNAFWDQTQHTGTLLQMATKEYEHAAFAYWWKLITYFPADFLLRFFAAASGIIELGYTTPLLTDFGTGKTIFLLSGDNLERIRWLLLLPPLLVVATLLTSVPRKALFLSFTVIYFAGTAFLQYDERHFFYLVIIPIWFVVAVMNYIASALWHGAGNLLRLRHESDKPITIQLIPVIRSAGVAHIRALAWTVLIAFAMICLVLILRWVQRERIESLLEKYHHLPITDAGFVHKSAQTKGAYFEYKWPLESNLYSSDKAIAFNYDYVVAEFDQKKCNRGLVHFKINYLSSSTYLDFSRSVTLKLLPTAVTRYYFPIFSYEKRPLMPIKPHGFLEPLGGSIFNGVMMGSESAKCLVRLGRMEKNARFPFWFNLRTPNIDDKFFYSFVSSGGAGLTYLSNTFSSELYFDDNRVDLDPVQATAYIDPVVSTDGRRWRIEGIAAGSNSYLIQMPMRETSSSDVFVVHGKLIKGALEIGVLNSEGKWLEKPSWQITKAGEFRVALKLDKGHFQVVISNYGGPKRQRNISAEIHKMGWASVPGA